MAINSPKVIDLQMRMPDASSFTWRTKMAATQINRRSDHVINNTQDLGIAPRLFSPQVMNYAGTGFGGRVQDASSYTMSRGFNAITRDTFRANDGTLKVKTSAESRSGGCLTRPPASQVVSERGNSEVKSTTRFDRSALAGLNMGYMRQQLGATVIKQAVHCTQNFQPLTKSYFVDTIPELKTHKIGSAPQPFPLSSPTPGGRQVVQNPVNPTNTSRTTNTFGVALNQQKADVPFNSYSPPPNNYPNSGANLVHGAFVTGIQGPQVGGRLTGGRPDKIGGVSVVQKGTITHRGWGGRTRIPYPRTGIRGNQPAAPAQLKINDPNHYKTK
jgi:hypothetical protein